MPTTHNKKNLRILLYYPFGMGDQIICQGIVREYVRNYGHITILAKDHNYPSVSFMYRDTPNITVLEIHKTPTKITETSVILDTPNHEQLTFDLVKIIGLNYLVWGDQSIQFEKQLYDIAGVPFIKKWENFFVERALDREHKLFERTAPQKGYIFLHEDPERQYLINRNLLRKGTPIVSPSKDLTENIFDYCTLIERADEIHVIDSSFMFLIDCLPYENPNQKLFIHRYARDNNECLLPILKKDWTIFVERHDKWEPIKDALTALWFHRYYQKRRFSKAIFKVVRKIFWIMRWNMTRPKKPDIHSIVQRYVPGRSFGQVVSPSKEHALYLSLARKMEATRTEAVNLSFSQGLHPQDVIFCSKTLTGTDDDLGLFRTLRGITDKLLILHIPHPQERLDHDRIKHLLMQAGFAIRERQLFRHESVLVCKAVPLQTTRFSVVTPVYNGEQYITETIESIISQEGDFEIEHIIQDGGSTDHTEEIVRSYIERIYRGVYPIRCKKITIKYISEKDNGMYDAVERGFTQSTGDIMAYLNADDTYLPGAFATMANTLRTYPEIKWVKGINTTANEQSVIINQGKCLLYLQSWLRKGIYGRNAYFVQQDSVFWKRSLWKKVQPKLASYRLAGDYALWIAFAQHAPLWSLNKQVSIFRRRAGQLSGTMGSYRKEQELIAPHHFFLERRVMVFFALERIFRLNPRGITIKMLFFILFPFNSQRWYIDFDVNGNPIKKKAASYLV